jgi:hypothetical protein
MYLSQKCADISKFPTRIMEMEEVLVYEITNEYMHKLSQDMSYSSTNLVNKAIAM